MAVYTDSPRYAATFLPEEAAGGLVEVGPTEREFHPLLPALFPGAVRLASTPWAWPAWDTLFITEEAPRSQYDLLVEAARGKAAVADRVVCLAGSGTGFHGFKGRSWAALPGNVHVAVHLAPNQRVDRFGVAFTALAALSVAEALDPIPGLSIRPRIKWINDILLGEAKAAGILAYTSSQNGKVGSAVLGFGINVETTPQVEPTPFVPEVASLRDHLPQDAPDARGAVFRHLLSALDRNYRTLLAEGFEPLRQRYLERSMVVGETVTVCTEVSDHSLHAVAEGRVLGLGKNLELMLDSRPDPVTAERLVLGKAKTQVEEWARGASGEPPAPVITGKTTRD